MYSYVRPKILFNRHLETIYPSLLRKVYFRTPEIERINTPDDDFLDLDWYRQSSSHAIIISHGLEGNSNRAYVRGMAKAFFSQGYDVIAWNYRGCSGEMNRQLRFYHSGATDDLHTVILHVAKQYEQVSLIGFSLGGNLTLKYLGEVHAHANVKKSIVFSVPMDLYSSCLEICKPGNWLYHERFLRSLKKKVTAKARMRKDFPTGNLDNLKTLLEFDDAITGPVHGFKNALDYYTQSSSIHFIPSIAIPTLVVNARNDPFLSAACYPLEEFRENKNVKFEFPPHGGHVGFSTLGRNSLYWSELRALSFIASEQICLSDTP